MKKRISIQAFTNFIYEKNTVISIIANDFTANIKMESTHCEIKNAEICFSDGNGKASFSIDKSSILSIELSLESSFTEIEIHTYECDITVYTEKEGHKL